MQVPVSFTIEIEASAGLGEMEEQVQEAGQQAMRQAMKQTIRQWEDQHQSCPHCGETRRRLEGTTRRVIGTRFGSVTVPRRRFRCMQCGRRCCPANRLFAVLKGATITPSLQEAAILAGCSWPYRVAAHLLKKLSGAQISARSNPSADQQARQTASYPATRGSGAGLCWPNTAESRSLAREAADAGRIGRRVGV